MIVQVLCLEYLHGSDKLVTTIQTMPNADRLAPESKIREILCLVCRSWCHRHGRRPTQPPGDRISEEIRATPDALRPGPWHVVLSSDTL